jgi:hypothetical protein
MEVLMSIASRRRPEPNTRVPHLPQVLALVFGLALGCGDDAPLDPDGGRPGGDGGSDAGTPVDASDDGAATVDAGGDAGETRADGGSAPNVAPYDCEASPGIEMGAPIEAPDSTWTWVPFPESRCMNGTSTGVGVSLSSASSSVVIYLQPGNACFDPLSCMSVANPDGFGASDFESLAASADRGIFDREDADNPVRDWSFVFVPYCTGDIHAGNNPEGPQGRQHVGFTNMTEYLKRLVPTFADADQVLLTGSSAGGFGAAYNFNQVQEAFGCTPVNMIDDAGPPMSDQYMRPCLQALWRDVWGLDATLPEDCDVCTNDERGGIVGYAQYLAAKFPDARFGMLSSTEDSVIRTFYSWGYSSSCRFPSEMPAADYEAGLFELRDDILGSYDNFETFYEEGTFHTFLLDDLAVSEVEGVSLAEWIRRMVEGEPTWEDVGP